MTDKEEITLKWGTLKSWSLNEDGKAFGLLKKYSDGGYSISAMMQKDTQEQKEILCQLIDAANCETVYNDWSGKRMTKEEAKQYVMEYN